MKGETVEVVKSVEAVLREAKERIKERLERATPEERETIRDLFREVLRRARERDKQEGSLLYEPPKEKATKKSKKGKTRK